MYTIVLLRFYSSKLERGPQNETLTHRSFSDKASMKLIVLPADLQKDAGSLFPAKTDEF
jgi:hypothetical protein